VQGNRQLDHCSSFPDVALRSTGVDMHGNLGDAEFRAINASPEIGNDAGFTPENGSDADDWFPDVAHDLLGDVDTGLQLHLLTGFSLSSCYAYVCKNPRNRRPVPERMLRALFKSDSGRAWHAAYMGRVNAPFWNDYQEAMKLMAFMRAGGWKLEGAGSGNIERVNLSATKVD
jgi:hypothetical protein